MSDDELDAVDNDVANHMDGIMRNFTSDCKITVIVRKQDNDVWLPDDDGGE